MQPAELRPSRSVSETALRMEENIPRPRWKLGFVVIEPASLAPMLLPASLSASELSESRRPRRSEARRAEARAARRRSRFPLSWSVRGGGRLPHHRGRCQLVPQGPTLPSRMMR